MQRILLACVRAAIQSGLNILETNIYVKIPFVYIFWRTQICPVKVCVYCAWSWHIKNCSLFLGIDSYFVCPIHVFHLHWNVSLVINILWEKKRKKLYKKTKFSFDLRLFVRSTQSNPFNFIQRNQKKKTRELVNR